MRSNVRQRIKAPKSAKHSKNENPERSNENSNLSTNIFSLLVLAIMAVFYYLGQRNNPHNSPCLLSPLPKISTLDYSEDLTTFWGTYRPHTYFSLKGSVPNSPVFGLIFLEQYSKNYRPQTQDLGKIHHIVENNDEIKRFGYDQHDGNFNFGSQTIDLERFSVVTKFVKADHSANSAGRWTTIENGNGRFTSKNEQKNSIHLEDVKISDQKNQPKLSGYLKITTSKTHRTDIIKTRLNLITDIGSVIQKHFKVDHMDEKYVAVTKDFEDPENADRVRLVAIQIGLDVGLVRDEIATGHLGTTFEITWTPDEMIDTKIKPMIGEKFDAKFDLYQQSFHREFSKKFSLSSSSANSDKLTFHKTVLSNMLGGLGFWSGHYRVKQKHDADQTHICPYKDYKTELYSASPSRPQFPRGFLWDEGFHLLLILKWNRNLAKRSLISWLNRMHYSGWIPREQIIGHEAESRVPDEFIPQIMDNANPPTLFLVVDHLLNNNFNGKDSEIEFIRSILPRLEKWFEWMYFSQQSELDATDFYWKGRSKNENGKELNPKTLTSGLDDFPRASHPNNKEKHIDMKCWLIFAAKNLAKITKILANDPKQKAYSEQGQSDPLKLNYQYYTQIYQKLSDFQSLVDRHYSVQHAMFADYGLHSFDVTLSSKIITTVDPQTNRKIPKQIFFQDVKTPPTETLVTDVYGYISLFPLFLEIIPVDHPILLEQINKLRSDGSDAGIWTEFGLRSISEFSPYYNSRNTEHDPPYWRGPIWININILTIQALKKYSELDGPFKGQLGELYHELKENVYNTVYNEWVRTGFIWEQYDDVTGRGKGTRAFTGWSALVVLLEFRAKTMPRTLTSANPKPSPLPHHPSNQKWYRTVAIIYRDNKPLLIRSLLNSGKIVPGTLGDLNNDNEKLDINFNEINFLDWTVFTSLDTIDLKLDKVDYESGAGATAQTQNDKNKNGSKGQNSITTTNNKINQNYIGILQPSDTHKIHGYVTASRVKFILILDAQKPLPRDQDIKIFFDNLHRTWMRATANPFYRAGRVIGSMPKFVKSVDNLMLKL